MHRGKKGRKTAAQLKWDEETAAERLAAAEEAFRVAGAELRQREAELAVANAETQLLEAKRHLAATRVQ